MKLKHIETPALILDLDLMEDNMRTMDALLAGSSIRLRPHYKSHKCPTLAHMQIDAGAKGITCAKLSEAEDLILSGIEDVLIANQVVHPAKIARLAYLAKCCHLGVCVDNLQNVEDLQNAAALQGSTLYCLVEYDIGMNRCGVHTAEEVFALAEKITASPNLVFEGIQAYAGNIAHEHDFEKRKAESKIIKQKLTALKQYLEERGIAVKEISGISTGTVKFHAQDSVYTEIQSGSYLFSDTTYNAVGIDFKHALFVLASVINKHDGAIITDAGLKTVSADQNPPVFKGYEEYPVAMSEEHSAIYADLPLEIGDKLLMIPSHCCTEMNLHDQIYFIRGGKVVDRVPITSRGKSL